jgi:hypothetical protein
MPIASIIRGPRLRRHGEYTGRRVSITGWHLRRRAAKCSIASGLGTRSTTSEEIVASISKRRSEAILKTYEKWGWLAVTVVWALAFLFAATLVLIALGTLIIYPFAGTEENTSVALLVGGILLVAIIVLGFTMRNRFPIKS